MAARDQLMWSRVPLFWRFQSAGWLTFTLLTFPLKFVLMGTFSGALLLAIIRDGSSMAMTLAMRAIYRRTRRASCGAARIATVVASVCLGFGLLQAGIFLVSHQMLPFEEEILLTKSVEALVFYERTGVLVCWSLLYFGIGQVRDGMAAQVQLAQAETARREGELRLLRAQMNPHFLFNSLTTIEAVLGRQMPKASNMLQGLAEYLRFSLSHRDDDMVPIGEEYDALMGYLALERARLDGELNVDCDIDQQAREIPVPGIILQPLVENAIRYGVETSPGPLQLKVRVARNDGTLEIDVTNTGYWTEQSDRRGGNGLGLENLQRRLALVYPGRSSVQVGENDGHVCVRIRVPAQ